MRCDPVAGGEIRPEGKSGLNRSHNLRCIEGLLVVVVAAPATPTYDSSRTARPLWQCDYHFCLLVNGTITMSCDSDCHFSLSKLTLRLVRSS